MFTKRITDSGDFFNMSASAQCLYFHICMSADDEGANNQVELCMFKSHATTNDLNVLIQKRFLLQILPSVFVVKHWHMHNTIRKDRSKPSNYKDEMRCLQKKPNGAYTLSQVVDERLTDGCQTVATEQNRQEQNRQEQNRLDNTHNSIVDLLTDAEFDTLLGKVTNAVALCDEIDSSCDVATIEKPLAYCLAVARNMGMLK